MYVYLNQVICFYLFFLLKYSEQTFERKTDSQNLIRRIIHDGDPNIKYCNTSIREGVPVESLCLVGDKLYETTSHKFWYLQYGYDLPGSELYTLGNRDPSKCRESCEQYYACISYTYYEHKTSCFILKKDAGQTKTLTASDIRRDTDERKVGAYTICCSIDLEKFSGGQYWEKPNYMLNARTMEKGQCTANLYQRETCPFTFVLLFYEELELYYKVLEHLVISSVTSCRDGCHKRPYCTAYTVMYGTNTNIMCKYGYRGDVLKPNKYYNTYVFSCCQLKLDVYVDGNLCNDTCTFEIDKEKNFEIALGPNKTIPDEVFVNRPCYHFEATPDNKKHNTKKSTLLVKQSVEFGEICTINLLIYKDNVSMNARLNFKPRVYFYPNSSCDTGLSVGFYPSKAVIGCFQPVEMEKHFLPSSHCTLGVAFRTEKFEGRYLEGASFSSLPNIPSIEECLSKCASDSQCTSINYDTKAKSCVLNNKNGTSMVEKADSVFVYVDCVDTKRDYKVVKSCLRGAMVTSGILSETAIDVGDFFLTLRNINDPNLCIEICEKTPHCFSFNYFEDEQICRFNSLADPRIVRKRVKSAYFMCEDAPSETAASRLCKRGYTSSTPTKYNMSVIGLYLLYEISAKNFDSCQTACLHELECLSLSYNRFNQICRLNKAVSPVEKSELFDFVEFGCPRIIIRYKPVIIKVENSKKMMLIYYFIPLIALAVAAIAYLLYFIGNKLYEKYLLRQWLNQRETKRKPKKKNQPQITPEEELIVIELSLVNKNK